MHTWEVALDCVFSDLDAIMDGRETLAQLASPGRDASTDLAPLPENAIAAVAGEVSTVIKVCLVCSSLLPSVFFTLQ